MRKEILKELLISISILTFAGVGIYFLIQNFERNPQGETTYKNVKSLGEEILERISYTDADIVKGPGGCRTEDECVAFCNNPDNQQICFEFARQYNLLSDAELKTVETSTESVRTALVNIPPQVAQCFVEKLGVGIVEKIYSGIMTPGPEVGEKINFCFTDYYLQKLPQQNIGIYKKILELLRNY